MEFDKRLLALADCPVMEDKGGAIVFSPYPVICAENDPILAHEICHVLAGRKDYEVFFTAVTARKSSHVVDVYKIILNWLYDWYHEYKYACTSGFLEKMLDSLHEGCKVNPTGIKSVDYLQSLYCERNASPSSLRISDTTDLVAMADKLYDSIAIDAAAMKIPLGLLGKLLAGNADFIIDEKGGCLIFDEGKPKPVQAGKLGGPKSDIGFIPKRSNYYIQAVARYSNIINELTKLWKRNRYSWQKSYFGEINWKNLPGMFVGSQIGRDVWRLFLKIAISRKIFLMVDRSGSTAYDGLSKQIMDTSIIITESLRMLGIPISILDVGVTDSIVNDIDEPLDLWWFTPMAKGGTPLGDVASQIKKADASSYLLIITDGQPDSWDKLVSSLAKFPGTNLTFVIGDSYGSYLSRVKNTVHVEPHTIIREMMYDSVLR